MATTMSNDEPRADEIALDDAVDRWLRKRQSDSTDRTLRGYRSRLTQFLEWGDDQDIETVADLSPWILDEYQLALADEGLAPTTVKGRLSTLRLWLEYLAVLGLVDEDLPDAVDIPNLSKQEEQDEQRLDPDQAKAAISFFRESRRHYGTAMHAFLELAWHTGARMGALRGLDLEDFDAEQQAVVFRHRPASGTPLKNKRESERFVGISEPVCEAIQFYIERERFEKRDSEGRRPLFCTRQGRASFTTLRSWAYQATQPCLWMTCPHGKSRPTCEWTERGQCSKCPSSRSPHKIRTGSITWQLNEGHEIERVADRVNAGIDVIKQYYDQAALKEEFETRRRDLETGLDITETEDKK